MSDVVEQIGEISAKMDKVKAQVQDMASDFTAKIEAHGENTAEFTSKVDKALSELGDLTTRTAELEKQRAREVEATAEGFKSLGELLVESEKFRDSGLTSSSRTAIRVQANRADITTAPATVGAGASAATSLVPGDRQPGIVQPAQRTMTIRNLLAQGETSTGSIEYPKETGFTNAADMVAEGALKPKSDITFDLVTTPVRTIAHIFKASRQIIDDAPALRSYIDARASYGLLYKEETQLLNGDGTGQNLNGLVPQASAFSQAFVPDSEQPIDRLRQAILQVVLAEYPATAFVLNPIDWAKIELTKDGQGRYIVGNPVGGANGTIWNLPVVATQAMAANNWLTGAFNLGAQIFDRMEIEVLLSTENVDDFEKNMMTIRAEERMALAVYRPESFVTGDFTIPAV